VGREFQNELKKLKSLSYVNDIVSRPEDKKFLPEDYRNRTDEINKNYEIKKVEGTKNSSRVGLLGYKMGMTAVWDKFGTIMPLTVIKVDNCQVTHLKTVDRDKYNAIQVGMGDKEPKNMTKPIMGHLIKNNIPPKRHFREFIVSPENFLPVGYMISVRHFVPGQLIDIIATSKGKGFQGVMKRWNFKGQFNTHGNSLKHRGAVYMKFIFRVQLEIEKNLVRYGEEKNGGSTWKRKDHTS
jgi:large subunit ribosomal protein L3